MTVLNYVLATENGAYNTTVPWGHLHVALNIYSRYKNVTFVRINDWNRASLRIVNARSLGSWAAYFRSARTIKIHPTVDYKNNPTTLAKVIQHECGHFRRDGHHNDPQGIMHPGGGSVFNWRQIDDPWWSHWGWRGSLRPWNEPNYFQDVFATPRVVSMLGEAAPTVATEAAQLTFECGHEKQPNQRVLRFSRQPKDVTVWEVSKSEAELLEKLADACQE
jgi:hypothetical protein